MRRSKENSKGLGLLRLFSISRLTSSLNEREHKATSVYGSVFAIYWPYNSYQELSDI